MKEKQLKDLEENYELELEKVANKIINEKAKKILLQFPEGFKPYALKIQKKLETLIKSKEVEFYIWFDSCFGACDLPIETERLGIDMIVQFGHSPWSFEDSKIKVL